MKYKNNPLAVRLYKYLSVAQFPYGHTLELSNPNDNIVIRFYADTNGQVCASFDGKTRFNRFNDEPTFENAFERAYNAGILESLCPKEWNPYKEVEGRVYVHEDCLRYTGGEWFDYSHSNSLPEEYVAFLDSLDKSKDDKFHDKPSCFDVFYAHCFSVDGLWYGAVNFDNVDNWHDYIFIFGLDVPIESLSHAEIHVRYLVPAVKKQYALFEMFLEWEMSK